MYVSALDFLPKYPNIDKSEDPLLNPYDQVPFGTALLRKKEFTDLKLPAQEPIPDRPGDLFLHQQYIQRFLSNHTPYDQLLIFHEMGTGKTCTAVGVIEGIRKDPNNPYARAHIFARGDGLLANFKNELVFKCTDGRYIPKGYYVRDSTRWNSAITKILDKYYSLNTFEKSASTFAKLSDKHLREQYSNTIIMIDEVHNLRLKGEDRSSASLNIYAEFYRMLRLAENSKIILMSGTPMKDQASEIGAVMNLILPTKDIFPRGWFDTLFSKDGQIDPDKAAEFQRRCKGRISYLKSMRSHVQKVYVGETLGDLKYFRVYPCQMSEFQSKAYNEAYISGTNAQGSYSFRIEAQQAALCVFPDGTYGRTGFDKYLNDMHSTGVKRYSFSPALAEAYGTDLKRYSIKYWTLLQILAEGTNTFAYIKFNHGSGSILLSLILGLHGYSRVTTKRFPHTKAKRFILVTNQTASIRAAIDLYNDPRNVDGEYIQLVIGSRIISEGYTLKMIRNIVIMGGHWNYSEISQAVARGWRVDSHVQAPPDTKVNIYQLVGIGSYVDEVPPQPSVDLIMYEISEHKDYQIKSIEYLIKVSCFDCALAKDRNDIQGYDYLRECEYQPCRYTCHDQITEPQDQVTFNLYYARRAEIHSHLTQIFYSRYTIRLRELQGTLPQYTLFELLTVLQDLISTNEVMSDSFGFPLFLRMENATLFLTQDISAKANFFSAYYSRCMIVDSKADYKSTVARLKDKYLLKRLGYMFAYPNHVIQILESFSTPVKLEAIKLALRAKYLDLTENVYARSQIIKFFSMYLTKVDDGYILTLTNQPLFFDINKVAWEPYMDTPPTPHVTSPHLFTSEIGYYGMINPTLQDQFCLKEINEEDRVLDHRDLRKVKVGKKCSDYNHNILVDIVANRIKAPVPPEAVFPTDLQELWSLVKDKNLTGLTQPDMTAADLTRILYWKSEIRTNLCITIQRWLETKNLIEVNENCGKQTKKRR